MSLFLCWNHYALWVYLLVISERFVHIFGGFPESVCSVCSVTDRYGLKGRGGGIFASYSVDIRGDSDTMRDITSSVIYSTIPSHYGPLWYVRCCIFRAKFGFID